MNLPLQLLVLGALDDVFINFMLKFKQVLWSVQNN